MERNETESHGRLERLAAVNESAEEIARDQSGKSISAQVNCPPEKPRYSCASRHTKRRWQAVSIRPLVGPQLPQCLDSSKQSAIHHQSGGLFRACHQYPRPLAAPFLVAET
jgi:hypothetical protein